MHQKSAETPANYIRFAGSHNHQIVIQKYYEELKTLLSGADENAGDVLRDFKKLADDRTDPSAKDKSDTPIGKFYSALHSAFTDLRQSVGAHPRRWQHLMPAIAELSMEDPTVEKYVRDILLAKSIPVLVGPQSSFDDIQAASDILTIAGTYENLADAVKPEFAHAVVKRLLEPFKHKFPWAATMLTTLRTSPPFIPVIADIENKHGVHVVGEQLIEDPSQILVIEFDKARHDLSVLVMDASKHGHHHAPRPVDIDADHPDYHDQIAKILSHSIDLPAQEWVEPIATNAAYRLG